MTKWLAFFVLLALPVFADERPVVVELFTSQGCSSCLPAAKVFEPLTRDPGVLALTFHVDYWNKNGWEDPFSSPQFSARQFAYSKSLRTRGMYTPQAVIDGKAERVGSDAEALRSALEGARTAHRGADRYLIGQVLPEGGFRIGVRDAGYAKGPAELYVVGFDRTRRTTVPAGENAGKIFLSSHTVRWVKSYGTWVGKGIEASLYIEDTPWDGVALLLQDHDTGHILDARRLR